MTHKRCRNRFLRPFVHSIEYEYDSACRLSEVLDHRNLHGDITLPNLHTLEIYPSSGSMFTYQDAAYLTSFLGNNRSISRLVVKGLFDHPCSDKNIEFDLRAAGDGINELIVYAEEIIDYIAFFEEFRDIKVFKLECDTFRARIRLFELLEIMEHLHKSRSGVKRLILPMPTSLDGLTRSGDYPVRNELSEFGMAFRDYLADVEVFSIIQVGPFYGLEAVYPPTPPSLQVTSSLLTALGGLKADWARALAGHPHLKKLAIRTCFLPEERVGWSPPRQELIDEIAREFSALPQLEQLVFPQENGHSVQVQIVRGESGVSGRETFIEKSMVGAVFFDPSLGLDWEW